MGTINFKHVKKTLIFGQSIQNETTLLHIHMLDSALINFHSQFDFQYHLNLEKKKIKLNIKYTVSF